MVHSTLRFTCDACGISVTINIGDVRSGESILERRKWCCPQLTFYGGTGHYCPNESCQRKAEEVRYKGNN